METDYIRDILEVAKYNSFNKASEVMNISTPAIRKRVTSVENELNQQIFIRNRKGVFLTKEGQAILEKLNKIYEEVEKVKISNSQINKRDIKVGLLPSINPHNIKKIEETEDLNFQYIINDNTASLIESLKIKEIDVAIGDIGNMSIKNFYAQKFYEEDYFIVYSERREKLNNSLLNLGNERIYIQTPPCDTLHFLNKVLKIKEDLLVYNDYFETILANVSANKGITLLPESYLDKVSDNLNYIKLEEYVREIGLISSSESLNAYVNEILSN